MSSVDTDVMIALIRVKFDGVLVDAEIQEVRVQDSLALPAAFSITYAPGDLSLGTDPLAVGSPKPKIGTAVEIWISAPNDKEMRKVCDGEITALEPNFGPDGVFLVASGYDRAHRLHRGRKTRTFQQMTPQGIVEKLAEEAKLSVRAEATTVSHEFVQQNNETGWELLQRLGSMHDFEAVVEGSTLLFRKIPSAAGQTLALEFGENASKGSGRLHSFYPRVTAAQQVKEVLVRAWNPRQKQAITATATVQERGSSIGIKRGSIAGSLGQSTIIVADAPVATMGEAQALASSLASYLGHVFVGAYGTCEGNPQIRAGATLKITGLGPEFSGTYRVSASTHIYGRDGYTTTFEVLGRSPRDLIDLARPAPRNSWGDSLVVGIVTNNQDKDLGMARVRVKYPTLDGSTEGAWARVVGLGAGPSRGQMMLPQVNDEVLIGFEGGDPHKPYVLGALWNGKDKQLKEHLNPAKPDDPKPDGSYVLRSPKLIDIAAVDNVKIKTGKDMIVEVAGKSTETVEKTQEVTVKQSFKLDAATELTLVCGQAKIVLKQSGEIQITGVNVTVEGKGAAKLKGATVGVEAQTAVTVKGATVAIN